VIPHFSAGCNVASEMKRAAWQIGIPCYIRSLRELWAKKLLQWILRWVEISGEFSDTHSPVLLESPQLASR